MKIVYIGNHLPEHSTETHVAQAFEDVGVEVVRIQENVPWQWETIQDHRDAAFVLWTRTWDMPHMRPGRERIRQLGLPLVGYHLDRWWGLKREHEIREHPFFTADLLITADGGHDEQWKEAGILHRWLPPAVSRFECVPARKSIDYYAEVAFVGSWRNYHAEWTHRRELVSFLFSKFGHKFRAFPSEGQPAIRGEELRKLYATTLVNVGDSCLIGGATRYISDRVPETLGRGGFLIHPRVKGIVGDAGAGKEAHVYVEGQHLATWDFGDWRDLERQIRFYLNEPEARREIASVGKLHVLAHHTYSVRARQIVRFAESLL